MIDRPQNGKHRMWADGDAVFWDVRGDIDVDEMRRCLELGEQVIDRHGRAFLVINGAKARSASNNLFNFLFSDGDSGE